jgi:hypothetical protein
MRKSIIGMAAVLGCAVCCAQAQTGGGNEVFNFSLVALLPTTNSPVQTVKTNKNKTIVTSTTKNLAAKVKVTNKEILKALVAERGSNFPAGAILVSEGQETIFVSDKTGTNVLFSPTNFTFLREVAVRVGTNSMVGTGTTNKTTTTTSWAYTDTGLGGINLASGGYSFDVRGLVVSTDSWKLSLVQTPTNSTESITLKESFKATGYGDGTIPPYDESGIFWGTVTGTGSFKWHTP